MISPFSSLLWFGGRFSNLTTNEEIIIKIESDFEAQSQFFDFMGRIVARVLINLNINLPFSRSEIIQKN